jgi:hypothetical protein
LGIVDGSFEVPVCHRPFDPVKYGFATRNYFPFFLPY